ncbi:MAG: HTTM domain-containing protein [Planctomycetales bacterium]
MSSSARIGSRELDERLGAPTDGSTLAFVRIAFTLQLLYDLAILVLSREIDARYTDPVVYFKYPFFPIIPQMPGMVAYGVFTLIGLLALAVLLGWRTSWTAPALAILYGYVFLVDATAYSDHYYLLVLLAILCAWLPVNRWLSSDLYTGRLKSTTVPAWTVGLFRVQVALLIFFSGLSRLNADWLAGVPLSEWIPIYGSPPALVNSLKQSPQYFPIMAWALALGPIVISLLLWVRPLRGIAVAVWFAFCACDAFWFHIGSSPILFGLLPVVFLPPDLPRKVGTVIGSLLVKIPGATLLWKLLCTLGKIVDGIAAWFDETTGKKKPLPVSSESHSPRLVSSGPATPPSPGSSSRSPFRFAGSPSPAARIGRILPPAFPGAANNRKNRSASTSRWSSRNSNSAGRSNRPANFPSPSPVSIPRKTCRKRG